MGRMGTQGGMVGRREPPAKGWERQGVERVPRAGWADWQRDLPASSLLDPE